MARLGNQKPTSGLVLPYQKTLGGEAVFLFDHSRRQTHEWQTSLLNDMMSVNAQGLWTHSKFGYAVPRRNGKGEILIAREIWGLVNGERILHTAHQTPTSRSAWERLCVALDEIGIVYKDERTRGLETIRVPETNGFIQFRSRTSKTSLGEGYDLLVIDEAQEYTVDQESALKYTVSSSPNPQTIMCGTPPTAVSAGTVFMKMRDRVLQGRGQNNGWAEWSVEHMTDPHDVDAWYMTNPNLGQGLTERVIEDEITTDDIDFNIQRLGLWLKYNQKSAISTNQWMDLRIEDLPAFKGNLFVGVKYSQEDTVALSIAVKTKDGRIFVEGIDCRSTSAGNDWILKFLKDADTGVIEIDGASGQEMLADELKAIKKKTELPKVKDIIKANAMFEQGVFKKEICHNDQPSMTQIVTNCEKRAIGSNGGFGYRSIKDGADIALMDSMILAFYACKEHKERTKQTISY